MIERLARFLLQPFLLGIAAFFPHALVQPWWLPFPLLVLAIALTALVTTPLVRRSGVGSVSRGEIVAALSVQAASIIFFYALVYRGTGLHNQPEPNLALALYFSLVTWTTLGYGDVTPLPDSQLLAASEALFG